MTTSSSDTTTGMTKLATAFRLGRGRPLCCYMCRHSDVSETRLCTLGLYEKAWRRMWEAREEMAPDPATGTHHKYIPSWRGKHQKVSTFSAAEFCERFEYNRNDMLNSRDQWLLDRLTKI